MQEMILEVNHVSSAHGALKDLNFKVGNGEFFVLLGPSGSGKTTMLNFICGMDTPADGQILIKGVPIGEIGNLDGWRAATMGYLTKEHNLIPTLSAYENVELPMLAAKVAKNERRKRAVEALETIGLTEKKGISCNKLTILEEQQVALARAIAGNQAIILADEPTGRLNRSQTGQFIRQMAEIHQHRRNTLIVATDDVGFRSVASNVFELPK